MDRPALLRGAHLICALSFSTFLVLVIGEESWWYLPVVDALSVGGAGELVARPWSLLTHVFVHRDPLEGVLATALLLLAGARVEERLGRGPFLALFGLTAAGVALAHVVLVEAGVTQARLFSGSIGASAGLLSAYLVLFGAERRVGNVPFPVVYVLTAGLLVAMLLTIDAYTERTRATRAREKTELALRGERLGPDERVDALWEVTLRRRLRADQLGHGLGLTLGVVALFGVLLATRARERYRVLREIRVLQEEVDARARVELLLEKISRDGLGSLSRPERRFLRYASRFYRSGRLPLGPGPA